MYNKLYLCRTLALDMKRLYMETILGLESSPTDNGYNRTDITFDFGGKKVSAHRLILSVRSEKMRAMFHFQELNKGDSEEVHPPLRFM